MKRVSCSEVYHAAPRSLRPLSEEPLGDHDADQPPVCPGPVPSMPSDAVPSTSRRVCLLQVRGSAVRDSVGGPQERRCTGVGFTTESRRCHRSIKRACTTRRLPRPRRPSAGPLRGRPPTGRGDGQGGTEGCWFRAQDQSRPVHGPRRRGDRHALTPDQKSFEICTTTWSRSNSKRGRFESLSVCV